MKKLFFLLSAVVMAAGVMAENYPTKFLGISIDGTKEEMIKKIRSKGFTYDRENDYLEGIFNGSTVHVYVGTNRDKVYRVMVSEQVFCSEGEIRIRYNNLLRQFKENSKYISYDILLDYIPDNEDISYEMTSHNKVYDAQFVQITHPADSAVFAEKTEECAAEIGKKLTPEEAQDASKLQAYAYICLHEAMIYPYLNNLVWFRIYKFSGKYYLTIYYDNRYNAANGEDL